MEGESAKKIEFQNIQNGNTLHMRFYHYSAWAQGGPVKATAARGCVGVGMDNQGLFDAKQVPSFPVEVLHSSL